MITESDLVPRQFTKLLAERVDALRRAAGKRAVTLELVVSVAEVAEHIQKMLLPQLRAAEARLEALRVQMAATVVPGGPEAKNTARYRRTLEQSMTNILGILTAMRQVAKDTDASLRDPLRVRLRVVK